MTTRETVLDFLQPKTWVRTPTLLEATEIGRMKLMPVLARMELEGALRKRKSGTEWEWSRV